MAFPVSSRSTGTLITASIWNNDLRDNINGLYAGALSMPSQVPNDFIYAQTQFQMGRVAASFGRSPFFDGSDSQWKMLSLAELNQRVPVVVGQQAGDFIFAQTAQSLGRLAPAPRYFPTWNGAQWTMMKPTVGPHDAFIPASAITPCVSNPCGWHERITLTHATYWALAFSGVADNWAGVNVKMPKSWNTSTITITPIWLSLSGNGGNVAWTFYGNALSNAESGNWSAAAGGSCTQANYGTYLITSYPAMPWGPAGVSGGGDNFMSIMIIRSAASNGGDTFPDPAYLLGFQFTIGTINDTDE
jgi:hypothetical protein